MNLRPLTADDLAAARAILAVEAARHRYSARPIEILEAAAARASTGDGEYRAVVAVDDAGSVAGLALYGLVAGTVGGGALYGLAVAEGARRRGVGRALVERACAELAALGARLAVAELPADPALGSALRALLESAGFAERSRVPDLVRDGVALAFLVRSLGTGGGAEP